MSRRGAVRCGVISWETAEYETAEYEMQRVTPELADCMGALSTHGEVFSLYEKEWTRGVSMRECGTRGVAQEWWTVEIALRGKSM